MWPLRASPDSRRWVAAGVAVLAAVLLVDAAGVAQRRPRQRCSSLGPLLVALGGSARATAAVAALAVAMACLELLVFERRSRPRTPSGSAPCSSVGALAVLLAGLRVRLERSAVEARALTRRAEETLALLDVIFERAPVGLAFHDLDGPLRADQRPAGRDQRPARPRPTSAARSPRCCPTSPEVRDDRRRVVRDGRAGDRRGGERRDARRSPASSGEWVASYWPVRTGEGGELIGRRRGRVRGHRSPRGRAGAAHADRPLRDPADRAVGGRRGHGRARGRPLRVRQPGVRAAQRLHVPGAGGDGVDVRAGRRRQSARRRAGARGCGPSATSSTRPTSSRSAAATARACCSSWPACRSRSPGRRPAASSSWSCATSPRGGAPRPSASGCCARSALMAEASALFDQSLDEERTLRSVAELCVRDLADTCVVVLGAYPGPARRAIAVAREPERERSDDARRRDDRPPPATRSRRCCGRARRGRRVRRRRAVIVVPLSARGRVLGALVGGLRRAARRRPRRGRSRCSRTSAGARRSRSTTRGSTRSARRSRRRSSASLLPPDLPLIPGAQVAARYLAAGVGQRGRRRLLRLLRHRRRRLGAGDRRRLRQGRRGGRGHGARPLHAARVRAAQPAPAQVLTELNEALLRQGLDYRFCTVLYASVTPRDGGARRRARHRRPPAAAGAARRRRRSRPAGRPGTLLGIVPRARDLRGARAARPGRLARALHRRRRRGQPVRRGARAGAARRAAAPRRSGATRARSPRRSSARRSRSRTAGCATTWRWWCCACAPAAPRRRLPRPRQG